jgi:hypothetical protein
MTQDSRFRTQDTRFKIQDSQPGNYRPRNKVTNRCTVTPAKAGVQNALQGLDSGFRRNGERGNSDPLLRGAVLRIPGLRIEIQFLSGVIQEFTSSIAYREKEGTRPLEPGDDHTAA